MTPARPDVGCTRTGSGSSLPDVDGALAELAYAVGELGCDGVTIETNAGGRYPRRLHSDLSPAEFGGPWGT
ncbi:hypothetical protein Q5425_43925 [Amycolatopsis sp. A133]|uniref:hypothetical protein n=1 Tax=Amycolatopsis sp. A133 TaxID=3064472 RepID=UPI0027F79BC3|nr:hypothetical protein [Amycolatopsis sp. A133]MDQ7810716.1 hypothetical protein [Amycolatopsis sp. A133]